MKNKTFLFKKGCGENWKNFSEAGKGLPALPKLLAWALGRAADPPAAFLIGQNSKSSEAGKGLAPLDLPPPILSTASRDNKFSLTRMDCPPYLFTVSNS